MIMYEKFLVYIDDGDSMPLSVLPVTAVSEEAVRARFDGRNIVAIKNVTARYPIDAREVKVALKASNLFSDIECEFICGALTEFGTVNELH